MYNVTLQLLKDCNLRCKYCFVEHSSDAMDFETARKAIDFEIERALKLNQKEINVTFFGGEPLLKFDMIKELTHYTNKNTNLKITFDLVTNGLLFDKEISTFFIENNFTVGISLDGTPGNHDLNRVDVHGNPTYNKIMKNIDNIRHYEEKTGKIMQVSMVVAKNTYNNLYENLLSIINLGFRKIVIGLEEYGYWNEEEWTIDDFSKIKSELKKSIELYLDKSEEGNPFAWNFIDGEVKKLIHKRKNYFCGCGIINNFITTDGSIYPCTFCTKEAAKIGHIQEGVYENAIEKFKYYDRKLSDKCENCNIKDYCSSCDCLMKNLENNDEFYKVSFPSCELAKIRHSLNKELLQNSRWHALVKKYERVIG